MNPIVLVGYKFKPAHRDIHYLSIDEVSGKRSFSTDITTATNFSSQATATRAIYKELSEFSLDDDYEWWPVLTNEKGEELGNIRPFFKVGSEQFKKQDLPNFLNIPDVEYKIGGMTLRADHKIVMVLFDKDMPICHIHGRPDECSLHNKNDPTSDTSALHFGCHAFIRVPNNVADQLVSVGVIDDREKNCHPGTANGKL